MTIADTAGTVYAVDDEDERKLVVNMKELLRICKRHTEWANAGKADFKEVLEVCVDLADCMKRIESCYREPDEAERAMIGDNLEENHGK